jgi:hypothetical protein
MITLVFRNLQGPAARPYRSVAPIRTDVMAKNFTKKAKAEPTSVRVDQKSA